MSRTRKTARQTVRCAVYTRKSTEEGLDQDFNSLDAQRESARAYIKSQAAEGWMCLSRHYDDGGFTGGNMDRPALHQRHRQEVTLTSRDPAAAVVGETAPRHHAVQMGVEQQLLAPGVQDGRETDLGSQTFRIGRQRQQGLRRRRK